MWWRVVGWTAGVWVAAGVQAACGGGMPGPLLLLALMAGLWSGIGAGMLVGLGAGLCDAALSGHALIPLAFLGMACGAGAGALSGWVAHRHPLVSAMAAVVTSLLICLTFGLLRHLSSHELLFFALRRAGENALWMLLISGIIFILSPRRSAARVYGNE